MTPNLPDLWEGCYSDAHRQTSPEKFKVMFCDKCLNGGCRNSKTAKSGWMTRILTQEERLLRNPKFASENDPAFQNIRGVDFKDLLQKALALEIADRKGDWSVPTATEVRDAARELVSPTGFQAPAPPPEAAEQWSAPSSNKNLSYEVTLTDGVYACACSAFIFSKATPKTCKHIEAVKAEKVTTEPLPPPIPEATPRAPTRRPPPLSIPVSRNTSTPSGGIMIGGGKVPVDTNQNEPDPWAIPERKIPVGGKIVLGGGSKPNE